MAEFGAYVLEPHPDGEPLWNWSKRDPSRATPEDQAKVERGTRELVAAVLSAPLSVEQQDHYVTLVFNVFRLGCVVEGPSPKQALRDLKALERSFVSEALGARISRRRGVHFRFSIAFLVLAVLLGLLLRKQELPWLPADQQVLANYAFVWASAMAALVVDDSVVAGVNDIDVYWQQERALSQPLVRVITTGLVVEGLSVGLSSGALNVRLGSISSDRIETSVSVALFVGFVGGLVSSDVVKLLLAKAKRALRG